MPRPAPPYEQTLRGRATHLRNTAARLETRAAERREQADALEEQWRKYQARQGRK